MSFVDLATLTLHRRNELEARINTFCEKCDSAVDDILKLKKKSEGFVQHLNCEPAELKDRFLSCMKQLDEYMYLITDFNLALSKIDETGQIEYTPVHDTAKPLLPSTPRPFNLIDALSEPSPSTSSACANNCLPEKSKKVKPPKDNQALIVFSSISSSEETVQQSKAGVSVKEVVQCELEKGLNNVHIEEPLPAMAIEACNLPAQTVLETDQVYEAVIMHSDGAFFWVITEDTDEIRTLFIEMTEYYKENHKKMSMNEAKALTYCAFYDKDSECYYRALFLKVTEKSDVNTAGLFIVDTGEMRNAPVDCVQPLYPRFCEKAPYARCCHLAGVDLITYKNKSMMKNLEAFMSSQIGTQCSIEVDDNTSESLGVYVILQSGETLNNIIFDKKLAIPIDKPSGEPAPQQARERCVLPSPPPADSDHDDILECPEYDDPVEAVTGYRSRDDAEICKHYKGGSEKTCFKGKKCTKKHIMKHPDGWTLDRVGVIAKCKLVPLPAPRTWHKVLVTWVCHYDRLFVHVLNEKHENRQDETLPRFGVVLPPTTLTSLLQDMNSPATRIAYKPLTVTPALGEMVAALYPLDGLWYRAKVMSITRTDQSVEVMYVDYGTVLWVKEDQLRALEPRHVVLPMQAVRCMLAGVRARTRQSQQWVQAKQALTNMVQDKTLDAHVVSRDYDEIVVELYDDDGYSIAEQLAAINMVELVEYTVVDDAGVNKKVVVP